jgi:hypothetical protein
MENKSDDLVSIRSRNEMLFDGGFDAIVYPSVAFDGGLNVAIKSTVFSQHFTVNECAVIPNRLENFVHSCPSYVQFLCQKKSKHKADHGFSN